MAAASHVSGWTSALRTRDSRFTPLNIRLMNIMTPLDHSKAVQELRWRPRPTPEAIAAAATFFRNSRRTSTE